MKKVLLLNGSGRGKKSTSAALAIYLEELLKTNGFETQLLTIRNQLTSNEKIKKIIDAVKIADFIILFAPLYDDSQPYNVVKIQEIIAEQKMNLKNKQFTVIVNSGFGEPEQISSGTVPILKKFASKVGFQWGGSLSIGGGEMLGGRYGKQLHEAGNMAKNAIAELEKIAKSLQSEDTYPDIDLILIPRIFYKWPLKQLATSINNKSWKKAAEKNGEKVDAKPFL